MIIVHSPYTHRTVRQERRDNFSGSPEAPTLVEYFTPKGYTIVISDVRGFGSSEGCSDLDGPQQAHDFHTLVEHFAAKPWSNGRVGSFGVSFDGEAANAGAVLQPEGLTTMVSVAALSGLYDIYAFDGVPYGAHSLRPQGGGLGGAALYAVESMDPPAGTDRLPFLERAGCQPEHQLSAADPSGDFSEYFRAREFRRGVANLEASVLYVQGLADTFVVPINIDGWYDELPGFKRAIFGQWGHARPDKDAEWGRSDWIDTVHAWYDRWLLRLGTGVEKWPPVQIQDEHHVWRAEDSFAGLGVAREYVLGDGTLGAVPGSAGSTTSFTPITQAAWSSAATTEPLHLSGQAVLDAEITLDQHDAHFVLTLEEVTASGSEILTYGYLSARHRDLSRDPTRRSVGPPEPVEPGVPLTFRIRTVPFDRWIDEGSTIRVALSGVDADTYPSESWFTANVSVDGASLLRLPVVDRECGLLVQQPAEPTRPIPPCPARHRP